MVEAAPWWAVLSTPATLLTPGEAGQSNGAAAQTTVEGLDTGVDQLTGRQGSAATGATLLTPGEAGQPSGAAARMTGAGLGPDVEQVTGRRGSAEVDGG
ncbi:hypothetical protein [Streptomyces sp. NPDC018693]|uniref:hypothetical protein n=1 Tax=unclassified Streptomyces TaxID=2593676 RepID=UPI0037AE9498